MTDSIFKDVEMGPPIEVFQLTKLCNECQSPDKVNLGVGAYRSEEGKPWVLPVVSAAEMQMANDKTLNHEYLPVCGLPDFREAAIKVLLGSSHKVITENRVEAFQGLGGTGALRLAAAFLKDILHYNTVYMSAPTWGNHKGVFKRAGFSDIREYRYWDNDARDFNFEGMIEDLSAAPEKSVVILHAVAHNPTGIDPTPEQWEKIFEVCKEKKLFVLMDIAYLGFASGDLDKDGWAVRYFAEKDIDMFIAESFSKNFGLYNERVGCLICVSKEGKKLPEVRSQMELVIRTMYSNPSNHGARIVATVLNNKAYYEDWKGQISTMANRIKKMRQELVENLKKLGTPGNWDHITKQIGMFSYTGLTGKQVEFMRSKYVYMLASGRISLCGLTSKNVGYVAKCMDEAVRTHPTLYLDSKAGKPDTGDNVVTFMDLAKKKLQDALNVIKTVIAIDGILLEDIAGKGEEQQEEVASESDITDFIKVRLRGSMSTISTPELKTSVIADVAEAAVTGWKIDEVEQETKSTSVSESCFTGDPLSNATLPGTLRSTVKTFSSSGAQTAKDEDLQGPKCIPARFQGTMTTPVFFEGLMITPQKLENLLKEAAERSDTLSIPVQFKGGMLAAAYKSLAGLSKGANIENQPVDSATTPVTVKFEGRLKGVMDPNICQDGIPVIVDGDMAHK